MVGDGLLSSLGLGIGLAVLAGHAGLAQMAIEQVAGGERHRTSRDQDRFVRFFSPEPSRGNHRERRAEHKQDPPSPVNVKAPTQAAHRQPDRDDQQTAFDGMVDESS
jgi:hypothetical protein